MMTNKYTQHMFSLKSMKKEIAFLCGKTSLHFSTLTLLLVVGHWGTTDMITVIISK